MPATYQPTRETIRYQMRPLVSLLNKIDRFEAARLRGDQDAMLRAAPGRSKTAKYRAYEAASWLNRYVLDGQIGDRRDGREVGYLASVDDLRAVRAAVEGLLR